MPTRVENKVDPNGGTERQARHDGCKAFWGACRKKKKKKKSCWYGCGCFRVPHQIMVSGCPAMRVMRNLKGRTKSAITFLVSMSWMQPTLPSCSSSSTSYPKPSKQLSASSDSHRNQAVQDCITYINSSSASCSSSSSIVSARSTPTKSSFPETPPRSITKKPVIAAVTVTLPPPPPHFSPISSTINKPTLGTPST